MGLITHLLTGFLMAFVGLLPPGMLNMTSLRMSIERGQAAATWFSAGAASVVFVQAGIALTFASFLSRNPAVLDTLKQIALVVFLILSGVFFWLARRKPTPDSGQRPGKPFWAGLLMSSMNMLAIPFFFGYSTILADQGWLLLEQPFIAWFVLGAVTGAFALLVLYGHFATLLIKRINFIASNINYILSLLFLLLAIGQVVDQLSR